MDDERRGAPAGSGAPAVSTPRRSPARAAGPCDADRAVDAPGEDAADLYRRYLHAAAELDERGPAAGPGLHAVLLQAYERARDDYWSARRSVDAGSRASVTPPTPPR